MLNLREIEIFKPYDSEFPADFLLNEGGDEACLDAWLASQTLRVAKRGEQVLGGYAMNRLSSREFRLLGVVVDAPIRKQGLGRWLVGHAIGVAESKGGRVVTIPQVRSSRCFVHMGFEQVESGWEFTLIPE